MGATVQYYSTTSQAQARLKQDASGGRRKGTHRRKDIRSPLPTTPGAPTAYEGLEQTSWEWRDGVSLEASLCRGDLVPAEYHGTKYEETNHTHKHKATGYHTQI